MNDSNHIQTDTPLIDRFGRKITYLRISVTDRCNLRCVYCMPPEGVLWQTHQSILSFEEIAQVARLAARHGVNEIRLTGGEPLVRKGLTDLIRLLARITGIRSISLTTNGLLLAPVAAELKEAGLNRVNISLDTLDPQKFERITRGGSFEKTWEGIEAAERVGLAPIKLNIVAMRGVNDDELVDMARLTVEHAWHVRFIELMPLNDKLKQDSLFKDVDDSGFISVSEIKTLLSEAMALESVKEMSESGPARLYRVPGALGRIGFISPISEHFCNSCNRLRLTADGHLRACLLNDTEVPIRDALRAGEDMLPYLEKVITLKPEGHELEIDHMPGSRCMRQIGG
jgi:GTP 3',8-cyclase